MDAPFATQKLPLGANTYVPGRVHMSAPLMGATGEPHISSKPHVAGDAIIAVQNAAFAFVDGLRY